MKKTIIGAAMCAALCAASMLTACGDGEKSDKGSDTLASRETSDTLCLNYGRMVGYYMCGELKTYAEQTGEEYNKDAFFKGLKTVLSEEHPDEYYAGVNAALRMLDDIKNMEKLGVQVNRKVILENLESTFSADSLDSAAQQKAIDAYTESMRELNDAARKRQEARLMQSPEAVKNQQTAKAFVDKELANNPNVKKTASGLYYTIEKEGDGVQVGANDRATVNYVGMHLDRKVFDHGESVKMTPGNGLIPGYAEALQLLKAGGKGTFYVPAELGYGATGINGVIAPNEMLIFTVEVLDVEPNVMH